LAANFLTREKINHVRFIDGLERDFLGFPTITAAGRRIRSATSAGIAGRSAYGETRRGRAPVPFAD
jgi:hypothetical protein